MCHVLFNLSIYAYFYVIQFRTPGPPHEDSQWGLVLIFI